MASVPQDKDALWERRQKVTGGNLQIHQPDDPLLIVKGEAQYLIDAEGTKYLDGVNNVCHLGHCHPAVVKAVTEQMSTLNTNSRYLHPTLVRFAEELLSTMPEGSDLTKVFFVNSGSEANDLAMRLAAAHTGGSEWIAVDHAYHGHTAALTPLSTYKLRCLKEHAAKGPSYTLDKDDLTAPFPHVHITTAPDVYRGPHTGLATDPEMGAAYAAEVEGLVADLVARDAQVAGFIAESMLSCGGQIILPEGYLAGVYAAVRGAGGVCIADEVQVGFGRVGTHWWSFQQQGVVPDIVSLGKPIGNGFPLAAVVTTPAIAASFNNGMPYFNTYGGNPVSCAAGLAVLTTIKTEGLMDHAAAVGEALLAAFTALEGHPEGGQYVGDVRGRGMFVGLELVASRDSKVPLSRLAVAITRRMRDAHHILVSTDGPFNNVIKMKPPLAFTAANAAETGAALAECLATLAPEAAKWAARELVAATGHTVPPSKVAVAGAGSALGALPPRAPKAATGGSSVTSGGSNPTTRGGMTAVTSSSSLPGLVAASSPLVSPPTTVSECE